MAAIRITELVVGHRAITVAAGVAPEALQQPPDPGGWNVRQIAYHLMDIERWYVAKLCEAVATAPPDALARFLAAWGRLREEAVTLAAAISADRMDRPGLLSGVPGWTPRALLAVMAAHDREHLAQITGTARAESGETMNSGLILHITTTAAWLTAQATGVYRAESLDSEGFLHCSTPAQVAETANRYFAGQRGLLMLVIDPSQLQPALVYEPATGGNLYPHLYGPLNLDAVQAVVALEPDQAGTFSLPAEVVTLSLGDAAPDRS